MIWRTKLLYGTERETERNGQNNFEKRKRKLKETEKFTWLEPGQNDCKKRFFWLKETETITCGQNDWWNGTGKQAQKRKETDKITSILM